jgi:VanZ family protein
LAHKHFYLWLAEFWTLLIAVLCLENSKKLPSIGIKSADKYVHFTFYFVFTILWFLYLIKKNNYIKKTVSLVLIKVFLAALFYGVLIEIAQTLFTVSRKGDVLDVLANTTGSVFAVILIRIFTNAASNNEK